jgi:uncharacterized protein
MSRTATPTRPAPDTLRTPRRPRRGTVLGVAALAVVAAAISIRAARSNPPNDAMSMEAPSLDPAIAGVYELEDGQQITLRPLYHGGLSYELDHVVVTVSSQDGDEFTSSTDPTHTISIERRDATGTDLTLERPDQAPVTARRVELYTEHVVTFDNGDVTLAGTLLVPTAAGPHPGIVITHGAERAGATRETYGLLATHYARRGVATLIYDKRGLGESTGDVDDATFDDLAADALAGHALLRAHPDIDPDRVGVAGFSQGGWIAAMTADRADDVAFVVAYSPSGFSPADQQSWLFGSMLAVRGFDQTTITAADRISRMFYSTLDLVAAGIMRPIPDVPGFWFHALDPHLDTAALWERVDVPVFALWGELDCQVPARDSARTLRAALDRAGNDTYSLRVLPHADHSLMLAGPCEHELGTHGTGHTYAPGYLGSAADWIDQLHADGEPAREISVIGRPPVTTLGWHQQPPAPAPWYGTATAQLLVMLTLLGTFATIALRWLLHRRHADSQARLIGTTALIGLAATLVSITALFELASLGAILAEQVVGNGPIAGRTPLFVIASILTVATAALGTLVVVGATNARLDPTTARHSAPRAVITAVVLLVVWAAYWQIPGAITDIL